MKRREQVITLLQEHYPSLTNKYPISSLSVFGSVAREEARPDSDVDILVEFSHPIGLFDFIGLKQKLETILNCPVDLGTPRSLEGIKDQVLREAIRVT